MGRHPHTGAPSLSYRLGLAVLRGVAGADAPPWLSYDPELEDAIRSARGVSGDQEVWVFGSQAILGEHPDAPPALWMSAEVDMTPKYRLDAIDGALGELSTFHATFGF